MPFGDVGHAAEIILRHLRGHRPGVAGNVVGAGHDVHGLGLQLDHVAVHAKQHLRCRLPADAAIDAAASEEARPLVVPALGDRIAEEDNIDRLVRGEQGGIIVAVIINHPEIPAEPRAEPLSPVDARRRTLGGKQRQSKCGLQKTATFDHQIWSDNEQICGRSGPIGVTPRSLNRTCAGAAAAKAGQCGKPGPFGSPEWMKFSQ